MQVAFQAFAAVRVQTRLREPLSVAEFAVDMIVELLAGDKVARLVVERDERLEFAPLEDGFVF